MQTARNITVKNMALTGVVGDGYGITGKRTLMEIWYRFVFKLMNFVLE